MPTIHLLTKNNESTILKTLESVKGFGRIVVGDLGSTDRTVDVCKAMGAEVYIVPDLTRSQARNWLIKKHDGPHLMIEPWEILVQGGCLLKEVKSGAYYSTIIHNKVLTKEIRVWNGNYQFTNPVFERLTEDTENELGFVFYSTGGIDYEEATRGIAKWKESEPLAVAPHYYHSCLLLSQGLWDDYLKVAEHYLFLDKSESMSAIMTRYYCAFVQLTQKRLVRPTLQNLNLCLCSKPLMAEFWCLTGDVYYHLLHKFDLAIEFYENAQLMGSRRTKADKWPMDIAKYNQYPAKMIKSCEKILDSRSVFHIK